MPKPSAWTTLILATGAVGLLATALIGTLPDASPGGGGVAVGNSAPALAGRTATGQAWDLASLRDKRAALVVFWASW